MKKIISALLCAAVLASSVLSGAVVSSAEQKYDGTIENYVSDIVSAPSQQNKVSDDGKPQVFTGNVAKGKTTYTSGVEPNMSQLTGDKAVDGVTGGTEDITDNRWSSGYMKGAGLQNGSQTPAWITIDLGAPVSDITSIKIYWYKLVWATDMVIQTSPDNSVWTDKHTITHEPASTANITDEITDVTELDRYVRFYAKTLNTSAGGDALSIREIEITGTQEGAAITVPASASAAINQIESLELDEDESNVVFPPMYGDYEFSIKGSDIDGIIADDGSVSPYIIGDRSVTVLAQVENTETGDRAEKNFTITVHDKSENFPDLFQSAANPNEKPGIIPAVQEWYGFEGYYVPAAGTKIVYNVNGAEDGSEQTAAAAQKAADILKNLGYNVSGKVEAGTQAGANDIYLQLLNEEKDKYFIGEEGNIIIANDNGVKIYANTAKGLLYGVYTVTQGLVTGDGQFPFGVIRDYPKFEVRGVMIDIARSPFRLETLKEYQEILSWFKINEMHMHINDDRHQTSGNAPNYEDWEDVEGFFRLESETFPGLISTPKTSAYFNDEENGFGGTPQYTKEEWRDFQKSGEALGINVITEIDMPGHSLLFTQFVHDAFANADSDPVAAANKANLQKAGINGNVNSTRSWELLEMNPSAENYENAQNLAKAIVEEYVKGYDGGEATFIGDTVHIGADEFWNATAEEKPGIAEYINTLKDMIEGNGQTVRMWGCVTNYLQGTTYENSVIDTKDYNSIELDLWATNYENPANRIADGYKIVNVDNNFMYNNALRDRRDITNVEHVYENWTPYNFSSYTVPTGEPAILGGKTAVWQDVTDMGVTETDNTERIIRSAAVVCEKSWGGTGDQPYTDFSLLFSKLRYGAQSFDPYAENSYTVADIDFADYDKDAGTVGGAKVSGALKTETSDGTTWGVFDGSTKLTTEVESISYPYTVMFDVQAGTNSQESFLFSGKDGWVTAGSDNSLKLYRAFFEQNVGYTLPSGAKNITFVGTQEAVKLYVDGAFVKILNRKSAAEDDYANLSTTFDFPLKTIGDKFKGKLANIKVYAKALSPEDIKAIHDGEFVEYINVAQNRGVGADGQALGINGGDVDVKKLRVGWKAIDGDGNALDGSHGVNYSEKDSFFAGQEATSYIVLDFWKQYDISRITLQWDNAPAEYVLSWSADGKNWNNIQTVTNNSNVYTLDLNTPVSARFVKMQGVRKNSNGNFQLREFMVFERAEKSKLDWMTKSYNRYLSDDAAIAANTAAAAELTGNPLIGKDKVDAQIAVIEAGVNALPAGTVTDGDANFDGKLNIKDATIIQKYAAGIVGYDRVNYLTADADGNGDVDGSDTTAIQKYLVGITGSLAN